MDSQRKTAEQVFISGVESSIARATQINQYDHLLITVLADLMQIQCIAAGNTDLLKFNLPSAIRDIFLKIGTHKNVSGFEWTENQNELSKLIFENKYEQDKFIKVFEMLWFSKQRAYSAPDIYLGKNKPNQQLCTDLLRFLNLTSNRILELQTRLSQCSADDALNRSADQNQISILKIWIGAIYMQSTTQDFGEDPHFAPLSLPIRCYLVEYDRATWSWKFFWSNPGQYGPDGNFITKVMKEEPPRNGERYFNDFSNDETQYCSTLTLTNMNLYDGNAFMYRQQFDNWIGAFLGSLSLIEPADVPIEWMNLFKKNSP